VENNLIDSETDSNQDKENIEELEDDTSLEQVSQTSVQRVDHARSTELKQGILD